MPDAPSIPSIFKIALGDLKHELNVTRKVLERIPDDRLKWRPHEKSRSVGQLAAHAAGVVDYMKATIEKDEYDVLGSSRAAPQPESVAEILERFDARREELDVALEHVDDEAMLSPWTLRKGDQEMFTLPRAAAFRTFCLSHMIHHRAQLTVYLRLLGVPVPSVYGPSADESA